ncbi:MAG: hypothetical protein J6Q78_03905 [Clostridia bacterium]|nr:hypothetical protein [Clostridia bacterium]
METNFDNKTYYEYETRRENVGSPRGNATVMSANNGTDGKYSTVAMILGIISLGLIFIGLGLFIPPALQIVSIVFAVKSRKYTDTKKMNGKAITGLVCSIVSLSLLLLLWSVIIIVIISILPLIILEGFDTALDSALDAEGMNAFVRALRWFIH